MRFRIYPNDMQKELIAKTFGCCRYVYNYYLAFRKGEYERNGIRMSYKDCSADLTLLKKRMPWLSEVDSIALQSSLKDLDLAYRNFFRGRASGRSIGYPRFKSKRNPVQSYKTKQHIELSDRAIRLPKLGWVKCKVSKHVDGRILNATVRRNASGKYFVSVCWTDVDIPSLPSSNDTIGIDMGLKDFAVLSDGTRIANPRCYRSLEVRLKRAQRRLSRKQRGSKSYDRQRRIVAGIHEKILNVRRDFLQKTSTGIIRKYGRIGIEDLSVKGMLRNHSLAKSIVDASWSEFFRMIRYKAGWYGRDVRSVDRFYASSQICHTCGFKYVQVKDLRVREWDCPCCNCHHDRDVNAAMNIRDMAFVV